MVLPKVIVPRLGMKDVTIFPGIFNAKLPTNWKFRNITSGWKLRLVILEVVGSGRL